MACSGRYASAWQFSSFWCHDSILTGSDNSGLAGQASLTDTTVDFVSFGVTAGVGMILYNLTAVTSGVITAVTANTITATGVTWDNGDLYRVCTLTRVETGTIENYLDIAAGDVHAAVAATGACDCNLSEWAENYLAKLNIIDAALYYTCPCAKPNLTDDMRKTYLAWMSEQLLAIRKGEIELCEGETGKEFPAVDTAEQSVDEVSAAKIIQKRSL